MRSRSRSRNARRLALAGLLVSCWSCGPEAPPPPSLLLISFDGLRYDYAGKADTPALDRLEGRGARVREIIPVFPTETFPNHYTIATGLLPTHHGIISNSMVDPEIDGRFTIGDNPENLNPRWWGGEPIWVTAAKAGLRSSAFFWPGSDVILDGHRPEPWHRFDGSIPFEERARTVVEWLTKPAEERPHLVTLYFELLDNAGHFRGPDSEDLARAVGEADALIGAIVSELEAGGALDDVNIVITGDHGMHPVHADQVIFLDDWIDLWRADVVHWSPVLAVNPDPDYADEALRRLRRIPEGLRVYPKGETPEGWNYREHRRITDIVGVAEPGWVIRSRESFERDPHVNPGAHGYDPLTTREMRTTLYAAGPGVRRGARIDTMSNLHIYEFLCALLEIECAPNDGDPRVTRGLLP